MKTSQLNIFFIIGVPRSGTHLIGKSISDNIKCIYINEINTFWQQFTSGNTDYIVDSKYDALKIKKIRKKYIERFVDDPNSIIIEKTAASALRLPFLKRVFPEAKFIHIIRDGRDVAVSIRKKYLGDLRKVTLHNPNNQNNSEKLQSLLFSIKRVLRSGLTLKVLIKNFSKYLNFFLSSFKLIKKQYWGLRYPGYKFYFRHLTLLESAARQWLISVIHIRNALQDLEETAFIEVFYEDLIVQPDRELQKCIDFILPTDSGKIQSPIHNINPGLKHPYMQLSNQEINQIKDQIGYLLKCHGYE